MGKSYKYKDLSFAVSDDTDVNFTVEFISDGNTGQTVISADRKEIQITDSGTKFIGIGKNLRSEIVCCGSNMANLNSHEDEIRIQYKINGQLLVEHVNLKSDEARPLIYLFITFTSV